MVPSEDVVLSITRQGYIKRTSTRSFNASGVTEVGLKDGTVYSNIKQLTRKIRYLFYK